MSTYSTVNYTELSDSIAVMTSISVNPADHISEIVSGIESMTLVPNPAIPSGGRDPDGYTEVGQVDTYTISEAALNIQDYSETGPGKWDWKFVAYWDKTSAVTWDNWGVSG